MYFLKILFKKKKEKKTYNFTLFSMAVVRCSRLFKLIVGTSNSLNVPKSLSWTWIQKKNRINKYYTRECISLFDGVESVVSVRLQVDTCGYLVTIVTVEYNVAFC